MTFKGCSSGNKKNRSDGKQPRPPTESEVRANNESSVKTAELLTDVSPWIGCIRSELDEMNRGKTGRPFEYCDTMILWIMLLCGYYDLTFRKAAGMAKGIMKPYAIKAPGRSTIQRRVEEYCMRLILGAPPEDSRILARYVSAHVTERVRRVAVDSTGLNLTQTTLWRKNKWTVGPKYRGWLKLHALTDIDTGEILAWILTEEQFGDSPGMDYLYEMVFSAGHRLSCLYADAAYDKVERWMRLEKDGVDFKTKFKTDTRPVDHGSASRGRATRLWKEHRDDWAEASGFGMRWKIECTFSDLKRIITEFISARTTNGMVRQVLSMVSAFNVHKRIRADILGTTGNGVFVAEI